MHTFEIETIGLGVEIKPLRGHRGLGLHWLDVPLSLSTDRLVPGTEIVSLQIELTLRGHGRVGISGWEPVRMRPGSCGMPVEFDLPLSGEQIEALDQARDHDDKLVLQAYLRVHSLRLEASAGVEAGFHHNSASPTIEIAPHEWRDLLKGMGWEHRIMFEVPVAGGRVESDLKVAADRYKKALAAFRDRRWEDVLVECRHVLDEMDKVRPETAPARKEWGDRAARENWSLADRLAMVRPVTKHAAQRGPHATGDKAIDGDVSRPDAKFVLMLTGLLLENGAVA